MVNKNFIYWVNKYKNKLSVLVCYYLMQGKLMHTLLTVNNSDTQQSLNPRYGTPVSYGFI